MIITIVVLLILAVVSIGAVRNSGIIGHATNTSDAWKKAQKEENTYLQEYESYVASSGATAGVPIPAGFEYVEGDKDSGLVITDGTNEFVWIPVDSGSLPTVSGEPAVVTQKYDSSSSSWGEGADMDSEYLAKAGITEGLTTGISENNSNLFLAQLTDEYDAMVASVAKYKGFYVGRYEVSNNGGKAQSVKGVTSAKASDSTSETWYGLYNLCKQYDSSSVTSSMIWSSQWEAIMNFIGEDNKNKTDGRNTSRVTGSVETDKIKNIYDLIGNSYEWTLTAANNAYGRVRRGGGYIGSYSPSGRYSFNPTYSNGSVGSRLTLYVEL